MKTPSAKAIGKTGLRHWNGVIDEEYLAELRGSRWRRAVERMQDDSILAASLLAIDLLIRQVTWTVTGDDEETAVFVDEARKGMEKSWDETISEILTFLPWGFDVQEIIYRRDGNGRVVWEDWSIRSQDTLESWKFDDKGKVKAVEQVAAPDYRSVPIPADKFLLFRTTARKGNPEGRSVLRGAYDAWYYARHLKRIQAMGIELDITGVPLARIPAEVIAAAGEQYDSYINLVANLRMDEQAGAVIPSDRDESGNLLYDLTLLSSNSSKMIDAEPVIDRYQREKAMALLTDLIMLGHGKTGTYALAETKQDMLANALNAYMEMIAETVNKYAIPRLLRYSGIQENFPKLGFSRIENVNLEQLGLFVKRLADSGFDWSKDEAIDAYLRQQADMPLRQALKKDGYLPAQV